MNIVLIVIAAIAALIAGIFFIVRYEDIDESLFRSVKGYRTFGLKTIYACTIIGAVVGSAFVTCTEIINMRLGNSFWVGAFLFVYSLIALIYCINVYLTFFKLNSVGAIIAKSLFMLIACIISFAVGFAGGIIVLCLLVIGLLYLLFSGSLWSMFMGSGKTVQAHDDLGRKHTLTDSGIDGYRDESGKLWHKTGDNEYES